MASKSHSSVQHQDMRFWNRLKPAQVQEHAAHLTFRQTAGCYFRVYYLRGIRCPRKSAFWAGLWEGAAPLAVAAPWNALSKNAVMFAAAPVGAAGVGGEGVAPLPAPLRALSKNAVTLTPDCGALEPVADWLAGVGAALPLPLPPLNALSKNAVTFAAVLAPLGRGGWI